MPLLTGREQIIFPRASALTKATVPPHTCGRRTAPKAAATQKKANKIRFDFVRFWWSKSTENRTYLITQTQ